MQSSIIELNKVIRYLLQNGWQHNKEFQNKKLYVFYKFFNDDRKTDRNTTIVLPAKETYADYESRLNDALEALSILENRDISEIVNDVITPNRDKLEMRIVSKFSEDGTIPLSYASKLIQGLRNLIVSAAYTEENPRPFFRKPSFRARKYGESFKLGQTKIGSYVVNIESNSLENEDMEIYIGESALTAAPFSRRIIQRIHQSMIQVKKFNQPNYQLENYLKDGYLVGLNANICESLLALYNEDESIKLETKIKYSMYFPPQIQDLPDCISLNKEDYHIIKMIAEAFREQEQEIMSIEGKISKLSTREDLESSAYGVITIDYMEDNSKRSVRVELDEDQYKIACDAHKMGKNIQVVGVLDFSKKSWEIVDLQKFNIL